MSLPRVRVLSMGGTIAAVGADRLDLAGYASFGQKLPTSQLLERVPEAAQVATITAQTVADAWGSAVTPDLWVTLARVIQQLADRDEADGFVVTHGTNTLEETAYFLHLALGVGRPIVVAGAMRPTSALSTDVDLNLLHAIRVAACSSARDEGVVVVLNETVHSARDVAKSHTVRPDAFQSAFGPLGEIRSDGSLLFTRRLTRRHTQTSELRGAYTELPRVDITYSYAGQDGCMIDAAVAAGARGIVVAGTGSGQCTPAENEAIVRAAQRGVVIVQGTRVSAGPVLSTQELVDRGLIASDDLSPQKARVLLMLCLARNGTVAEIRHIFATH